MYKKVLIFLVCIFIPASLFAAKDLFLLQDTCVRCHTLGENDGNLNSVISWRKSVHFRPDSGCADCHGGNKLLYMDFKQGHIGLPTKIETIQMCGTCHPQETNDFMNRPMGAPGEFNCTATCVNCHDYHNVPAADASLINKSNCGACHPFEKAKFVQESIAKVQTSFSEIEKKIELKEKKNFPVASVKIKLDEIKRDFSRSFHSKPLKNIPESTTGETMPALEQLNDRMSESSPWKWKLEGAVVLIFFITVVALIIRFQKTTT